MALRCGVLDYSAWAASNMAEMASTAIDLCCVRSLTGSLSRDGKGDLSKDRNVFASRLGSSFFTAVAAYSLVLSVLYDLYCIPLLSVAALCICIVIGLFQVSRWGLWLAIAFIPVLELVMFSTLSSTAAFVSGQRSDGLIFRASLIVIILAAVLVFLVLLDKKKEFK